jgi:hypothetical protein
VQIGYAVSSLESLSQLQQIENAVKTQGGIATDDQKNAIQSALTEFSQVLLYIQGEISSSIAQLKTFSIGVQQDHDALAGGQQDISTFEGKMQTAIENQMQKYMGSLFGAGMVTTLGQIGAAWKTSLDGLNAVIGSVLAANELAETAIGSLETSWTTLQNLAGVTGTRLQNAEKAAIGSMLQELDLASAINEWNDLSTLAITYSNQLQAQAVAAGSGL